MRSQISGLWDVCYMNFVHYRKLFYTQFGVTDFSNSFTAHQAECFPAQASFHSVQPEGVGREDQRGEVQENPLPILRRAQHPAQQNAQLKGLKY